MNEGDIVVGFFVPVYGAVFKRIVIGFFRLLDKFFDTDVFSKNVSGTVKKQKCEQAAHSSVSVIERVDAEEIQHEHRNN